MGNNIQKLVSLYNQASKHSNYQKLSSQLSVLMPVEELNIFSRYEEERLKYILDKLDINDKVFYDIGCNCGYFSFELIKEGASKAFLYEGNRAHAEFVENAAELLHIEDKIIMNNQYFDFSNADTKDKADVMLLLNVLHHVGDDYGESNDVNDAKSIMLDYINGMACITEYLVLQIGFNWKGNRELGLFEKGTKEEIIQWLREGIENVWEINSVGIAENENGKIIYNDMNEKNIERIDELGEFLNRPIFILKRI